MARKTSPKTTLHRDEPDPEDHVRERRRKVLGGHLVAGGAAPDREQEDQYAGQSAGNIDGTAREHPSEPARKRAPAGGLEQRPRPQDRKRDERDDQDDRGRPPEATPASAGRRAS